MNALEISEQKLIVRTLMNVAGIFKQMAGATSVREIGRLCTERFPILREDVKALNSVFMKLDRMK